MRKTEDSRPDGAGRAVDRTLGGRRNARAVEPCAGAVGAVWRQNLAAAPSPRNAVVAPGRTWREIKPEAQKGNQLDRRYRVGSTSLSRQAIALGGVAAAMVAIRNATGTGGTKTAALGVST